MEDLTQLLLVRPRWIERRVDRLELVDLTTAHRTITFTLDVDAVKELAQGPVHQVPLALFRRNAGRAGIRVTNGAGEILAHLSGARSDDLIQAELSTRLQILGLDEHVPALKPLRRHAVSACREMDPGKAADVDVAAEKWGCPAAGKILRALADPDLFRTGELDERQELARLLFDWQNNTVLVVPVAENAIPATVIVTYDEELQRWLPPYERRPKSADREARRAMHGVWGGSISRGGPFKGDLDELMPKTWPRSRMARAQNEQLRAAGRRGSLGQVWHVAWEQTSYSDARRHHLEVVVPAELMVVRMRLIAEPGRESEEPVPERVHVADEVGRRAHLVAPEPELDVRSDHGLPSTFLSVLVAHRDAGVWLAACVLAAGTAAALGLGAWLRPSQVISSKESAVTALLLAPTLVATLLSFRAGTDIASRLTTTLRMLLGLTAALAAVAAAILTVLTGTDCEALRWAWTPVALLLFATAVLLACGADQARRLERQADSRERAPGEERNAPGQALTADRPNVTTPPPARWIESGEGDRVPWGWAGDTPDHLRAAEDSLYWDAVGTSDTEPLEDIWRLLEWRTEADWAMVKRARASST